MQGIVPVLTNLFRVASRVLARTSRGLIHQGIGKVTVNAVRRLHLDYAKLSDVDKLIVDETAKIVANTALNYVEHHDESNDYRIRGSSIEAVMSSHAEEIYAAAEKAVLGSLRSHAYDAVMGSPAGHSIFQKENILKQLILSLVQEWTDNFSAHAEG